MPHPHTVTDLSLASHTDTAHITLRKESGADDQSQGFLFFSLFSLPFLPDTLVVWENHRSSILLIADQIEMINMVKILHRSTRALHCQDLRNRQAGRHQHIIAGRLSACIKSKWKPLKWSPIFLLCGEP